MSDEQPKCVRETQEMTCLNCGQDAHILVAAECWVRLLPDDQVEFGGGLRVGTRQLSTLHGVCLLQHGERIPSGRRAAGGGGRQ